MHIYSEAFHQKNTRNLTPAKNAKTKLWVTAPTLFRKKKNAMACMNERAEELAKSKDYVRTIKDPDDQYRVIEFTDSVHILRVTKDSPED